MLLSAWKNRVKICGIVSCVIPIPVSDTLTTRKCDASAKLLLQLEGHRGAASFVLHGRWARPDTSAASFCGSRQAVDRCVYALDASIAVDTATANAKDGVPDTVIGADWLRCDPWAGAAVTPDSCARSATHRAVSRVKVRLPWPPEGMNLTAFRATFETACISRGSSPTAFSGSPLAYSKSQDCDFFSASERTLLRTTSKTLRSRSGACERRKASSS
mmetsp:Transcript_4644/g.14721  ORF Transcript_4644/g.14721 Transcript_4644/m.14721 type:complete len:217 (+) Transcript_4644:726-1376(+)